MAAETITIEVEAVFNNRMGSGMSGATSQVDRFNQSVNRARERMRSLSGQNARPTVSLLDHATSSISRINSSLRGFAGRTFRAGVKVTDYATRPLRSIKNMLFSIKSLAIAVGSALMLNAGVQKGIVEPIGLADQYSSAKIGFSTLLGKKKGQQMMDDLDTFAKKTPFKTSNTIAQAQKLVAMGWDAKNIVKDMYTIGDAAAATGKGDEGLQRIALALSQIKSKGKLSTEELNQLAEAGISAKRYIAEGLGYGGDDKGIAKLSKDLEAGSIMANEAIDAILKGMKEYKGMMDRTANETVEGLKSQIEDTFEINVFRKWGQGLQTGAKKGFGSIVKFLDANEGRLKKFGETLKGIGKNLSTWAAGKVESTIDKLMELSERSDFKNASLFGKVKIVWDEIISKPFGAWWDSNGKPYIEGKFKSFGKMMGEGLTNATLAAGKGILSLLGVDTSGMEVFQEASSVGSNFGKGFAEGFDGKKIMNTIKDVFVAGFKSLFSGGGGTIGNIIKTGIKLKLIGGVLNGISAVKGLWNGTGAIGGSVLSGIGLKGAIGSASNGTGLLGWGAMTGLKMGAGVSSSGFLPLGYTAAVGLGATAGGILGTAGLLSAGSDYMAAKTADNEWDKKRYNYRAGTKAVMVGGGAAAGAATGAAIGSIFGGIGAVPGALIGAGIGGATALWKGNKVADSISGCKKSYAELNEEIDKLARKDMKKRFGEWAMDADQLSKNVKRIVGKDTINRVNKLNTSLSDLETVQNTLADNKYTIDYASAMINGGGKLSASDINEYKTALKGYASATKDLLTTNKKSTRSAFQLLYGDDSKGMANMTKGMEKIYSGLEGKLAKKSKKLNDVIAKAFQDGKITIDEQKKIDELVSQIEKIQDKVEERVRKTEEAQSDATYDIIAQKHKYEKLTPESFKTLISELDSQNQTTLKGYDDAYIKAKAEIDVEFSEGKLSKSNYNKKLKKIESKWRQGKADTIHKSVEVSLDVVKTNYGDSFSQIEKAISGDALKLKATQLKKNTTFSTNGLEYSRWDKDSKDQLDDLKSSFLKEAGIDKKMQKEMKDLYSSLKPQEKDLLELKKSYEDAGKKVPQWIVNSLSDIDNIKLMSGNSGSFYTLIGEQLAKEDSTHAKQLLADKGSELPKALKEGIENGLKEVESVEKNETVKVKAKKVDTKDAEKKSKSKTKKSLSKKQTVKKDVDVKVKAKKVDTKDAEKKSKSKTKKSLGKKQTVKKDTNVKVKQKTDTGSAKQKSNDKTKKEMSKKVSLDKKATVKVKDDTKTNSAKKNSESKIKSDLKGPVTAKTKTNVNASFGSFNGTLAKLKKTVFSKIKDELASTNATTTVNITARRNDGSNTKKQEKHNANGSRIDRETLTWVGENNNREYIIPTTSGKRQRGLSLWMEAGKDLGVIHNADGGVYGSNSGGGSRLRDALGYTADNRSSDVGDHDAAQKVSGRGNVEINVGGITIEIKSSGDGVATDVENNKDRISNILADALSEAFQNIPLATE